MNKGFTLMEILAVLLVIAVLASFAVPMFRSVTVEVRYQRAKVAAVKLAEAIRIFYTDTKGFRIDGDMVGTDVGSWVAQADSCQNPAMLGIPPYQVGTGSVGTSDVSQLFFCNYLSSKDFTGLNYRFSPQYCLDRPALGCLVAVADQSATHNKGCFWVNTASKVSPMAESQCGEILP